MTAVVIGIFAAKIADTAATVDRGIAIKNFFIKALFRNANTIVVMDNRGKVADHQNKLAIKSLTQERDD